MPDDRCDTAFGRGRARPATGGLPVADKMKIAMVAPVASRCLAAARACSGLGEIEILTTCAGDESSWREDTEPGLRWLGGVALRSFRADYPRVPPLADRLERAVATGVADRALEERWMQERGPCSWALLDHLARQAADFDACVFFGLMTATAVFGLPSLADRAILVAQLEDGVACRPLPGLLRHVAAAARTVVVASDAEGAALAGGPPLALGVMVGAAAGLLPEVNRAARPREFPHVVVGEPAAVLPELLRCCRQAGLFAPRRPS